MSANELIGMKAVRSLVAAVLALVVLARPTVVLAAGRVVLVIGNNTYAYIGRLPNPDERRPGHVGGVAAARVRGDFTEVLQSVPL